MTRLIKVVFLALLTSLPALARRVKLLNKVRLETEISEDGKKDTVEGAEKTSLDKDRNVQAGGLEHAAGAQGAATLMQEVQRGDAEDARSSATSLKNAGDCFSDFRKALKIAFRAVYAEVKAATRAELYLNMDPGSDNAREFKNKANAAAAAMIDAETLLCERTELLAREDFGGEMIVEYMLEGDDPGRDKTLKGVLERLRGQVEQLEIKRVGFNHEDIVGLEKFLSRVSAMEGHVKAMQSQELDSDEIDLTKPLLSEANAMYPEIVKFMTELRKVQLSFLRKIIEKRTDHQGKAVQGTIALPPKMNMELVLNNFLKEVEKMEQRMEMEATIKEAIEEFLGTQVSTPAAYRLAKEELGQAVKVTMEKLQTFDLKMKERQKAKINEAMKWKKLTMANAPRRNHSPS